VLAVAYGTSDAVTLPHRRLLVTARIAHCNATRIDALALVLYRNDCTMAADHASFRLGACSVYCDSVLSCITTSAARTIAGAFSLKYCVICIDARIAILQALAIGAPLAVQ
jgi:hypothetical protein